MSLKSINKIGIVGGGMSSLMICIEAAKLGITTCLLDPQLDCLASRMATEHIVGNITNENLKKLSLRCDYIIYNTRPDFEIDTKLHAELLPAKSGLNELYCFKNILDMIELVGIPTSHVIYEVNNEEAFKDLSELKMPFRFIKLYQNYSEQLDVFTREDLTTFVMDNEEEAESYILQPISDYKQIASCICIMDKEGKIYQYEPIQETTDDELIYHLNIGDCFTKNMVTKLSRYNRKLLKEINTPGIYTIKYGIRANKSIEFIEISPVLGLGSLLTTHAYQVSIFEQMIRMILGKKPLVPQLIQSLEGVVVPAYNHHRDDEAEHHYECQMVDFFIHHCKEIKN